MNIADLPTWASTEEICEAVWEMEVVTLQAGKKKPIDGKGFVQAAKRLFGSANHFVWQKWGIAISDAIFAQSGAEIRWDGGKPYVVPVGDAIPEDDNGDRLQEECDAIFTETFTGELAKLYQATWGGTLEHAMVQISLFDRYCRRGELLMNAITLLNLGEEPAIDIEKVNAFWEHNKHDLIVVGKNGQISMFGVMA